MRAVKVKQSVAEVDIAAAAAAWLEANAWEVFQEVRFGGLGSPRADIVGRLITPRGNRLIWIVEAKASLSMRLLGQAMRWRQWAHFVSIIVPHPNPKGRECSDAASVIRLVLHEYKIGRMFYIPGTWRGPDMIQVDRPPGFNRHPLRALDEWDRTLKPQHKSTLLAGSAGGGYWTPFRETCGEVKRFVELHPGCDMKSLIHGIKHHYRRDATALASLRTWIADGKIKEVRAEIEHGKIRLFPVGVA